MRSSGILPAQQGAFKVEVTNLCALLQQIEVGFDMEIGSLVDAGRLAPAKGSIEDD